MTRMIDVDLLIAEFEKVYPLATNEMGGVVNKKIYDIINSIPVVQESSPNNPAGDLISREALKEAMNEEALNLSNGGRIFIENINKIIDNAQTSEQNWRFYYDHGYAQAKRDLGRPQGKWIPMSADCRGYSESFKCSICGAYIYPRCLEKELDYNFCPYCGADMRTEDK